MTRVACLVVLVLSACTGRALETGASRSTPPSSDGGAQHDAATTPGECSQTCGPHEVCFTDCCQSAITPCYARPSGGCKHGDDEIPSCNGVARGCACDGSDPSKCPAPPSCDHAREPFCLKVSGTDPCDFTPEGGNPCYASAGECDPNTRVIICTCSM